MKHPIKSATALLLFLLLVLLSPQVVAGQVKISAQEFLQRSADKIKQAECLNVAYTARVDGQAQEGMLTLQGDMFIIASPGMMSWYDGKTQWTYTKQIGEINVITPTPQELQQINPLAIIRSFGDAYIVKMLPSTVKIKKVLLTAKNPKSDITKAEISINADTMYPTGVLLTMSNKQTVSIAINDIHPGGKLPAERFRFDPKLFPGIPVVDLR